MVRVSSLAHSNSGALPLTSAVLCTSHFSSGSIATSVSLSPLLLSSTTKSRSTSSSAQAASSSSRPTQLSLLSALKLLLCTSIISTSIPMSVVVSPRYHTNTSLNSSSSQVKSQSATQLTRFVSTSITPLRSSSGSFSTMTSSAVQKSTISKAFLLTISGPTSLMSSVA